MHLGYDYTAMGCDGQYLAAQLKGAHALDLTSQLLASPVHSSGAARSRPCGSPALLPVSPRHPLVTVTERARPSHSVEPCSQVTLPPTPHHQTARYTHVVRGEGGP